MSPDDYAYTNRLRNVHPGEKLTFTLTTMAIGFITNLYLSGAIIILMGSVSILIAGVPAKVYTKLLMLPTSFLMMSLLSILISFGEPENALLLIPLMGTNLAITLNSLRLAIQLLFKSVSMVSCLYFLSLTTPITDLIPVLRGLKVPGLFLELMLIIYRYLFVLSKTARDIYTSQAARLGDRSFKSTLTSLGMLVSALFLKAHHDAQRLYTSLLARGYDGDLKVMERHFPVSRRNLMWIGIIDALLLIIAVKTGGN